MITDCTCVVVTCDNCQSTYDTEREGVFHFDTAEQARAYLTDTGQGGPGWRFHTDGTIQCATCALKADCAAHGHQWEPWRACMCDGSIPLHQAIGCPHIRWCGHCYQAQQESYPKIAG